MSTAQLAELLATDPSVLFITGAGVSAASGIPTYRGVTGLYNDPDPELGLPIEELLSEAMWRARPELTWRYLRQIGEHATGARPNLAHQVIAALQRRLTRAWVLTQNVDGLHQRAGSEKLIAIHGDAADIACRACGWAHTVASYDEVQGEVPACPDCGGNLRPEVVLFDEQLPAGPVALYRREVEQRGFDVVVSVGTSHVFPYINQPVISAYYSGKATVLINPEVVRITPWSGDDELDCFRMHLKVGAVEAFGQLAREMGISIA